VVTDDKLPTTGNLPVCQHFLTLPVWRTTCRARATRLLLALLHPVLVHRSQALGATADLQQTILYAADMMDHLHGSALAFYGNARQAG